jgi:hypothetical protein
MAMWILSSKLGLHRDWYNNNRDSTINRGRFKEPNKDVTIDMPMLFGWDLELVVGGFINTGTTRNTVKTANPTRRWINLATVRDSYYPSLGVPVFSTATLSTNLDSSPNAGSWFTSIYIYILGRTFGPDTRGVQGTVSPIFGQSSWQSPRFW